MQELVYTNTNSPVSNRSPPVSLRVTSPSRLSTDSNISNFTFTLKQPQNSPENKLSPLETLESSKNEGKKNESPLPQKCTSPKKALTEEVESIITFQNFKTDRKTKKNSAKNANFRFFRKEKKKEGENSFEMLVGLSGFLCEKREEGSWKGVFRSVPGSPTGKLKRGCKEERL